MIPSKRSTRIYSALLCLLLCLTLSTFLPLLDFTVPKVEANGGMSPLHTFDRYIKDSSNNTVVLYGGWKSTPGYEDSCVGFWADEGEYPDFRNNDAKTYYREAVVNDTMDLMVDWGFNSYPDLIFCNWWLGNCTTWAGAASCDGGTNMSYLHSIKRTIELAADRNLYVQLRPYGVDRDEGRKAYPHPVPSNCSSCLDNQYAHNGSLFQNDQDFADFWYNVSYQLANYSNVIYCLYDEPQTAHWNQTCLNMFFNMCELCVDEIRQAEQDANGYTHLTIIHYGYCAGLFWVKQWINEGRPTNNSVVFSGHIYRYHGSFPTSNVTYAYLKDQLGNESKHAYKYLVDEGVPVMCTAIGAESGASDDDEYECFQNCLTIFNEWDIGYWGYCWWLSIDGALHYELSTSSFYRAPSYANRIGEALMDAIGEANGNWTAFLSQTFSTSWTMARQWTTSTVTSLTITTSWIVESIEGGQAWVADLTQSLSTSWNVLTEWNALAGLSQSLSTSWTVLTQSTFNIIESTGLSTTWSVVATTWEETSSVIPLWLEQMFTQNFYATLLLLALTPFLAVFLVFIGKENPQAAIAMMIMIVVGGVAVLYFMAIAFGGG